MVLSHELHLWTRYSEINKSNPLRYSVTIFPGGDEGVTDV